MKHRQNVAEKTAVILLLAIFPCFVFAQWEKVAGPGINAVNQIKVRNNSVFTAVGPLFNTLDSGMHWQSISPEKVNFYSYEIVDSFIIAQAGIGTDEFYFSADYGNNWNITPIEAFRSQFGNINKLFSLNGRFWVETYDRTWEFETESSTFKYFSSSTNFKVYDNKLWALAIINQQSGNEAIISTGDSGITWDSIPLPFFMSDFYFIDSSIIGLVGDTIYARDSTSPIGWTPLTTIPEPILSHSITIVDDRIFFIGDFDLYEFYQGSWVVRFHDNYTFKPLSIAKLNNNWFLGTQSGCLRSMDEMQSWNVTSTGLPGTSGQFTSTKSYLFIGGMYSSRSAFSNDSGQNWFTPVEHPRLNLIGEYSNTLYAFDEEKIFCSTGNLTEWTQVGSIPINAYMLPRFEPLDSIFYGWTLSGVIIYSKDFGVTWQGAISTSNVGNFFLTHHGSLYTVQYNKLFRLNASDEFELIATYAALPSAQTHFQSAGDGIFVCREDSIFVSLDNGFTWTQKPNFNPQPFTFNHFRATKTGVVIGRSDILLFQPFGNDTFIDITYNYPWYSSYPIIGIVEHKGNIFISEGNLWKTPVSTLALSNTTTFQQEKPKIYPNPCTESFFVDLSGLNNEPYVATLLNLLGQTVTAINDYKPSLQIDLKGIPGGQYFLQLSTRNYSAAYPIQVVK